MEYCVDCEEENRFNIRVLCDSIDVICTNCQATMISLTKVDEDDAMVEIPEEYKSKFSG